MLTSLMTPRSSCALQVERQSQAEERHRRAAAQQHAKRPPSGQPGNTLRASKKRPLARVLKAQTPQLLLLARRLHEDQPGARAGGAAARQPLLQLVQALRQAVPCSAAAPGGAAAPTPVGGQTGVEDTSQRALQQLVAGLHMSPGAGRPVLQSARVAAAFTAARDPFAPRPLAAAAKTADGCPAGPSVSSFGPPAAAARPAGHARLSAAPALACAVCERGIAAVGVDGAWACSGGCRRACHGSCAAPVPSHSAPLCAECAHGRRAPPLTAPNTLLLA